MNRPSIKHYMGMEALAFPATPEPAFDADYTALFADLTRLCRVATSFST
jgi:hypothetical protein